MKTNNLIWTLRKHTLYLIKTTCRAGVEGSLERTGKKHSNWQESEVTPMTKLLWQLCLHPWVTYMRKMKPFSWFLPEVNVGKSRLPATGCWKPGNPGAAGRMGSHVTVLLDLRGRHSWFLRGFWEIRSGTIIWDMRPSDLKYIRGATGVFVESILLALAGKQTLQKSPSPNMWSWPPPSTVQWPRFLPASGGGWQLCSDSGLFWEAFRCWHAQPFSSLGQGISSLYFLRAATL